MKRLVFWVTILLLAGLSGCWVTGSVHDAAKEGKKEVVQRWLSVMHDINERDTRGNTPLHCAIEGGQKEIAVLLLEKGADVSIKNEMGNTPLHEAAYRGNQDLIKLLLSKGADPATKAADGKTARELALKYQQVEAANLLQPK